MRRFRALVVSAVSAAAVGLAAPSAAAWNDDPDGITVTPQVIARGGQLTISADAPECRVPGSTVESEAFPRTTLQPIPGSNRVTATVRVFNNANRGSYDVTARCDGRTFTKRNAFTVIGGVQGGLGGSTTGAAGTDMLVGGGLVGAALLGGSLVLRHRRAESKA
ncbi:hypothetical protein [Streptomyces sp. TS71-3]|uniref:hypothetical protein n=1 Tax=Streptomyces sp. TS71-3 TaxID=2733862 RepID=UPI001B25511E|nr:hypothetical protein [Streptomyces sp. TS71-3]GHJ42128.1 hypothetical protein Sm713_77370 [Streptomyces sp. TS71-3]